MNKYKFTGQEKDSLKQIVALRDIPSEKLGRRCFAIEIDPLYADVILTRWAEFSGKDPIREDGATWSSLQ